MRHCGTRLPLLHGALPVRAGLACLWLAAALLPLALLGCGSAASPRWAGARPSEAPTPAEAPAVRPPDSGPSGSAAAARVPQRPDSTAATAAPAPPPPEANPALREPGPPEAMVEVPALVPAGGGGYRIGVGDELEISLPFDRDLGATSVVRPDGMITAPLIQDIRAAGRTTAELDSVLKAAYARIYRHPVVTVGIRRLAQNQVYIMGEVTQPGALEINGSITLVQLIARAGGARSTGTLKSVVLLRRGLGNQVLARRINVARILEGDPENPDVPLVASDIVYVPRSFIGKLNLFVEQYINGLISPILNGYLRGWEVLDPNRFFYNPNYNRPSSATGTGAER